MTGCKDIVIKTFTFIFLEWKSDFKIFLGTGKEIPSDLPGEDRNTWFKKYTTLKHSEKNVGDNVVFS